MRFRYFDGCALLQASATHICQGFLSLMVNDHENDGIFECMRVFYADRLLPLSFLELLLFALCMVRWGTQKYCVGEHELLPCFPLWLISELPNLQTLRL